MIDFNIPAKITEFPLESMAPCDSSAIIPTVKGTIYSKYGEHAYYFLNFKTLKALTVEINHFDIIKIGLDRFAKANNEKSWLLSWPNLLLQKYHYGFSFLEQIMLMTVPHAVTCIGQSRFLINLWSYYGYLEVDCRNKTVKYKVLEENGDNYVLGSQQWHDNEKDELYYMTYSLKDSLKKSINPYQKVFSRILKQKNSAKDSEIIWVGEFVDYLHDLLVNKNRQYCVACELGMFLDSEKNIIPSKVLILDLKNKKQWIIDRFIVAAHAQFDPDDPDVIYFSNHNFQFVHSNIFNLLKNATYSIKFRGPASVFKYRLTSNGPQELGEFTDPKMFRLTNFQVFNHKNKKIVAGMGFPNFIFFADAKDMKLIDKIELHHPVKSKPQLRNWPCIIGTFSPSLDGEKLFVHTNYSFQVINVASGKPDFVLDHSFNHTCSNHMLTSNDTNW